MRADSALPSVTAVRFWRMMLVVTLVGLIFGLLGMGEVLEDALRTQRVKANQIEASGKVVLVTIDDKSQRTLGPWPWNRSVQAEIIEKLHDAGADRVMLDLSYDFPTNARDDAAFEAAAAKGTTLLPTLLGDSPTGVKIIKQPLDRFAKHTKPSTIAVTPNWQMVVWSIPFAYHAEGRTLPFASTVQAGGEGSTPREDDARQRRPPTTRFR